MAKGQLGRVLTRLRGLIRSEAEGAPTDAQLLGRFAALREEESFAALVQRHGGLVLGVCRRVLADEHEAEDAFQATFLVLARKAGSIRKQASVGSWLYGVAYRIAAKARAQAARRRVREQEVEPMTGADPLAELVWRELRPVIDEELSRLPDKYRHPVVLCYLENKTNAEAARQLGWTKGTVSGRLARARELLRARLRRRGLALSAGVLTAALAENAMAWVPASLGVATVKAAALVAAGQSAAGVVSASVAAMAEGVLKAMLFTKLKVAAFVVLTLAVLGAGTAFYGHQALAGRNPVGRGKDKAKPPKASTEQARLEGTWRVVSLEEEGKEAPAKMLQKAQVVIKGNKIVLDLKFKRTACSFTVDAKARPPRIDLTPANGPDAGQTIPGIYSLQKDQLKLCLPINEGKQRPKEFDAPAKSSRVLLVLKRQGAAKGGEEKEDADDVAKLKRENALLRAELAKVKKELQAARLLAEARAAEAAAIAKEAQAQRDQAARAQRKAEAAARREAAARERAEKARQEAEKLKKQAEGNLKRAQEANKKAGLDAEQLRRQAEEAARRAKEKEENAKKRGGDKQ
jgi:RNA polymerase sigma factor (sigma-70 family)